MSWTPRSQRVGLRDIDGPYDGVPAHLAGPLLDWLRANLYMTGRGTWRDSLMRLLSLRLRIEQPAGISGHFLFAEIVAAAKLDEDMFLDIIEGVLITSDDDATAAEDLRAILRTGGSSLTVAPSNDLLVDVVGETAAAVAQDALSVADITTDELQQAWKHAYGRSPDSSDAWDHAIKALESVLVPIVEPTNTKATLGSVISVLNAAPQKWQTIFPGTKGDNDIANLVATLRLTWPNPDRHVSGSGRTPNLDESRAVVGLVASIVQAHRQGWVVKAR